MLRISVEDATPQHYGEEYHLSVLIFSNTEFRRYLENLRRVVLELFPRVDTAHFELVAEPPRLGAVPGLNAQRGVFQFCVLGCKKRRSWRSVWMCQISV